MAQTGYTPILLYSSTTAAQAPAAGNLTNSTFGSELAINITDGKLFYKDNTNAVQVIAWKTTPTTAGGTGLTSYTAGDLPYYATGTTLSKLAIGSNGQILTSTGTAPQWTTLSGVAVTTFSAGTTGFTPSVATSGAITLAGTLATTNGGTGLSSFTANGVFYASSTSVVAQSASLTFSGTTLTADNYSTGGNLTFTGTSNRITGDFSNATFASRVAFQTSTTNGNTLPIIIPNGTATTAALSCFNNSDPTNSNALSISSGSTVAGISSSAVGTGTALPLTFSAGGSERIRIDTAGNVGVGSNSPLAGVRLDVFGGYYRLRSNTTINADISGNVNALVLESSGGTGEHAMIAGGNTAGNFLTFYTANAAAPTEKMRIFSSGGVSIGNTTDPGASNLSVSGNVVIATSGKGIDFSATAGTGTSELLADYEEGTWTPTVLGGTTNPTMSYTTQSATYTKVGRLVSCQCLVRGTRSSGGSGKLQIGGLPFTVNSNTFAWSVVIGVSNLATNLPAAGIAREGTTTLDIYTSAYASTQVTDWATDNFIYCSFSFEV